MVTKNYHPKSGVVCAEEDVRTGCTAGSGRSLGRDLEADHLVKEIGGELEFVDTGAEIGIHNDALVPSEKQFERDFSISVCGITARDLPEFPDCHSLARLGYAFLCDLHGKESYAAFGLDHHFRDVPWKFPIEDLLIEYPAGKNQSLDNTGICRVKMETFRPLEKVHCLVPIEIPPAIGKYGSIGLPFQEEDIPSFFLFTGYPYPAGCLLTGVDKHLL